MINWNNIKTIEVGSRTQDLTGLVFNRLTVLGVAAITCRDEVKWLCQCECGNLTIARSNALKMNHSNSCGCYRYDQHLKAVVKHGKTRKLYRHRDYQVWLAMRERCRNPNNNSYHLYGGRGISVCKRWDSSFDNFIEDMGDRPSLDYSIDRYPNKDGNYEPGNCRWATKKEQNFNLRTNVWVEYLGEKMVLAEFKRRIGEENNSNVNLLLKKMTPNDVAEHYLNKSKKIA